MAKSSNKGAVVPATGSAPVAAKKDAEPAGAAFVVPRTDETSPWNFLQTPPKEKRASEPRRVRDVRCDDYPDEQWSKLPQGQHRWKREISLLYVPDTPGTPATPWSQHLISWSGPQDPSSLKLTIGNKDVVIGDDGFVCCSVYDRVGWPKLWRRQFRTMRWQEEELATKQPQNGDDGQRHILLMRVYEPIYQVEPLIRAITDVCMPKQSVKVLPGESVRLTIEVPDEYRQFAAEQGFTLPNAGEASVTISLGTEDIIFAWFASAKDEQPKLQTRVTVTEFIRLQEELWNHEPRYAITCGLGNYLVAQLNYSRTPKKDCLVVGIPNLVICTRAEERPNYADEWVI